MASRLRRPDWSLFGLWALAGALVGLGLADIWSEAALIAVPGVLLGGWLAWQLGVVRETFGLVSGLSALPWSVLYDNDFDACEVRGGGSTPSCPDGVSLWPLVVAGVVCVLVGGVGVAMRVRISRPSRSDPPQTTERP